MHPTGTGSHVCLAALLSHSLSSWMSASNLCAAAPVQDTPTTLEGQPQPSDPGAEEACGFKAEKARQTAAVPGLGWHARRRLYTECLAT